MVQQELSPWLRPVLDIHGTKREYSRVAGVSSFGAGGANAHVVIEEYRAPVATAFVSHGPAIVLLSARHADRLHEQVQQLLATLVANPDIALADLAYTLQVGREAMEERLAVLATSLDELREKLRAYAAGQTNIEELYRGQVKRNREALLSLVGDDDMLGTVEAWLAKGKYGKLLDMWVKGLAFDWRQLYGSVRPRRISLPTYPFARERYWVSAAKEAGIAVDVGAILQRNTSDESGLLFSAQLRGDESYLSNRVLPDVAQLEMARRAVAEVTGETDHVALNDMMWIQPIVVGDNGLVLYVALYPEDGNRFGFEIYSANDDGETVLYSQGVASTDIEAATATFLPAQTQAELAPPPLIPNAPIQTLLLQPLWTEQAVPSDSAADQALTQHRVLLCGIDAVEIDRVRAQLANAECMVLAVDMDQAQCYEAAAAALLDQLQQLGSQRGKQLLQIVVPSAGIARTMAGLGGMLRTAQLENARLVGHVISIEAGQDVAQVLLENCSSSAQLVRYVNGLRQIGSWTELQPPPHVPSPWKSGGVYLITGGAGGLGLIFAREIAQAARNPVLILTGRSPRNETIQANVRQLEALGAVVRYHAVDVADAVALTQLVHSIPEDFESLDGIIHSAGVLRDSFIVKKTPQQLHEVLSAKVAGTLNLDQASKDIALDCFICFSSLAAAVGNVGQADYAAANAFMDAFALHRAELVANGQRRGRTLSIDWPLWDEGGMHVDAATRTMMIQQLGMHALASESGVLALRQALATEHSHVAVVAGNADRIRQVLLGKASAASVVPPSISPRDSNANPNRVMADHATPVSAESVSAATVTQTLSSLVATLIKVNAQDLDGETVLSEYGFDSVTLTEFCNAINQHYRLDLKPMIFFEYPTIHGLSDYLLREHASALQPAASSASATAAVTTAIAPASRPSERVGARRRLGSSMTVSTASRSQRVDEPIAIIGMSGQFPQARDLDAFWHNLRDGKDCISEIPPDRWDWRALYGDPAREENKTHIKWAGFIDGVDEFDPMFFSISPKEAEMMDPQQRLMMIHIWKALEDAGYAASSLSGSDTAIYVGTGAPGYGTLLHRANLWGQAYSSTGGVPSVGPNRISYLLNFHGPSEPVETACSSSLVALRRGVAAIQQGESSLAIVGAVNTIVTPEAHISLNKSGMLCEDGRCKTFSSDANGYVRGEGVAMLVLKKLSAAERDGDHIHGLIRGTAENHGGRANSLTAPNPSAQAAVVSKAHREARIDPRTVTYIETHGTGTPLGDPIEINGLKSAFKELYAATGESPPVAAQCGLGSVKTNIGHLELAAGVAGVIKVLLQMKHKTLVKSLHSETLNPYIDFSDSPFYVVQQAREWTAIRDAHGHALPRRAGVSSFGFGGVNTHVVLEEYIPSAERAAIEPKPVAVTISARNEARLREQVQALLSFISSDTVSIELSDLAYTLQVGREAMEERLGLVVGSLAELREKLAAFLAGRDVVDTYRGKVARNKENAGATSGHQGVAHSTRNGVEQGTLPSLLARWVKGASIAWSDLYGADKPRRISLPTYAFARERYGLSAASTARADNAATAGAPHVLHPLLHRNTSDLSVQQFSSHFDGREFFLADHRVEDMQVLPGVAQLEMVLAGAREATHRTTGLSLSKVTWARPIVVDAAGLTVHMALHPQKTGAIRYDIYSHNGSEQTLYGQGTVLEASADAETTAPARNDLAAWREHCNVAHFSAEQCYAVFEQKGMHYGPAFRGLNDVYVGHGHVLARIALPPSVASSLAQYRVHPSLLDAALQAPIGLQLATAGTGEIALALPFALEAMDVFAPCTRQMWAAVRYSAGSSAGDAVQKLDIDLCDDTGLVCVRLKQFSFRLFDPKPKRSASIDRSSSDMDKSASITTASSPGISNATEVAIAAPASEAMTTLLHERSTQQFKKLIGKSINMSADAIEPGIGFDEYGIDSFLVMELTNALGDVFGADSITTTLLFEYQNIESLVEYFMTTDAPALMRWTGLDAVAASASPPAPATRAPSDPVTKVEGAIATPPAAISPSATAVAHAVVSQPVAMRTLEPAPALRPTDEANRFRTGDGLHSVTPTTITEPVAARFDVAIIGLSGRYPGASNVNQFWDNLAAGRNCISELPPERWDNSRYYDEQKDQPGKTYSKWAGLLDHVDCFDRLFFNISPQEAQLISPQERLFLQEVYASIEDAGYTPKSLSANRKIGTFVGVLNEHYPTGVRFWSIANRVSYVFNFQGPSMAVDTACSSSLTAVHLAIDSLRNRDSDVAIAGGVNLITAPEHLIDLSSLSMLSSGDKCRSFGADGDGFVDSEAVGALILKPLHRAVADGDHIYGVIKGSAVNSGGKTNNYMVPNPNMQAQLVTDALERAGVDARWISYMEAQGTGSSLGDPIEIAGLSKAFRNWTLDKQFCALGSAKSNIGHSESASGFVAISKVLMQMKHQLLAPTLHASTPNPNIKFADTPFVLQQNLTHWSRPVVNKDGEQYEVPRIAGVSSFGAGGANAHVVIEEYIAAPIAARSTDRVHSGPAMVVLSARDTERLHEQVQRLLAAITPKRVSAELTLANLAYTLQTGREEMSERLALQVDSLDDLRLKLLAFADGKDNLEGVYHGHAKRGALSMLAGDEDLNVMVQSWIAKGKFGKLLELWVKGLSFDWNVLYGADGDAHAGLHRPTRISLPTYPFARERCWTDVAYPDLSHLDFPNPDFPGASIRAGASPTFVRNDTPASVAAAAQPAIAASKEAGAIVAKDPMQTIAGIWRDLLGRPSIESDDNFFGLGGNSVLATRLASRIRSELRIEAPVQLIFEAPVLKSFVARIDALEATPQVSKDHAMSWALQPMPRGVPLRLSFGQVRLWFLNQYESRPEIYNIPAAVRLLGQLDVSVLSRTLNEIVRRHEALRTSFVLVGDETVQVIAPPSLLPLQTVDVSGLPPVEREARSRVLIHEAAAQSFDLANGPLVRFSLLRLAEQEYVLLLTMHHIVSDGWSMGIVVREVAALYAAFIDKRPSPLPALPIQYADFAHWQREWLSGDVLDRQLSYWKQQLSGSPNLLALPTDRPRPTQPSHNGAAVSFAIPATLLAALQAVGLPTQSTLFMTLCAAFNILLARYSGQSDLCIGTPIAGRHRSEIEDLIGFFVNTLVLRTRVDLTHDFNTLLQQVRQHTLDAYAHQDVPFEQLVEVLQPERHASYTPLFQVMLVLQNTPMDELALPGLSMNMLENERVTAMFDLTLTLVEDKNGLRGTFEYSTDLFEAQTIERMAGHFTRLLQAIANDPGCAVGELAMVSDTERQQLLYTFNDTAALSPNIQSDAQALHQLFEAQAARTPDQAAVVYQGVSLTYAQLNAQANRLARHLRMLGVGPDVLVGLCVERSVEMIVALLGVLKAGGAYVPLDPAYPAERLSYSLADSAPIAVLVNGFENLPPAVQDILQAAASPVVDLHRDANTWEHAEPDNLDIAAIGLQPHHLAYIIYTSGSTGKPKGVMVQHDNVVRLLSATDHWYGFGQHDVWTLFHSYAFDFSVWEIWGALAYGGKLVVVPQEVTRSPLAFYELLCAQQVTVLNQTPSAFRALIAAQGDGPRAHRLRYVIFGGEALELSALKPWYDRAVNAATRLVNMYGITETTVHVTYLALDPDDANRVGPSPIGRQIPDLQIYVLDAQRQPVPLGVAGELYVGGAGVARGYLNRPELTAGRFMANPFVDDAQARLYKTGDMGRWLADGSIEYLGRNDEQVKIRGFRIELGEIEARIAEQPAVREAVVIAREDQPGDKRLVAYLVAHEGHALLDEAQLRTILAQTLPDYMVPSYFIVLDTIPLTANGKTDRKALPAPDMTRGEVGYLAPRTAAEEIMAGIWVQVLKRDKVGVHDNFFALGGHSLLATQLLTRICTAFDVELPLSAIFETSTLAELVTRTHRSELKQAALPMQRVDRNRRLPLSFAQLRLWFLDQYESQRAVYNIPAAVRLAGQLDVDVLTRTLNEIVRRHEALRTSFVMVGDEAAQVIASPSLWPLPVTDLSSMRGDEQEARLRLLMQEEAGQPFDLATGPLIRFSLLRLADKEHVLLLTMHHIVSDGWSMGIVVREVAALYTAFTDGRVSPLPELPIQYADFAHWQRQWLSGDVLERQLSYWKQQLADSPSLLALPTDRPRPAQASHRGATVSFALPATLVCALQALGLQTQSTLFMTLGAAFNVLLARYSGQSDLCIGTPIANRHRSEIEDLIGFFVNTLILRTQVDLSRDFNALLRQVRITTLDAYAHQDVPFEQLVEVLQPERHASYTPLFQVMLVLQNTPMDELALPGLAMNVLENESVTAKFDLMLTLVDDKEGMRGSFEYSTDLFEAPTIERMASHFTRLLHAIVTDPYCAVGELGMLGEDECQQLVYAFNDTATVYPNIQPDTRTLQQLFEAQVARTPDHVAVVYEGVSLSYSQLNAQANRLARHLRMLGVGPDALVGLCVERSVEMIVGLFGILKAGGAYVPLDPAYPAERLATILADARPAVVLTQLHLRGHVPTLANMPVFCLDQDAVALSGYGEDNLPHLTQAANLAYVIYTSGSTGKPKGVGIDQQGIVNRLQWMQAAYPLTAADRVLQKTPYSFDVSVWEFFWPLIEGATLVVARPGGHQDVTYLADLIDAQAITTLHFVPPMLEVFLNEAAECGHSLRQVMCSGQALPLELQERFFAKWQHVALHNLYGPTEASVDVTAWQCRPNSGLNCVPIGQPIANIQIHILDASLNPVPVGVVGHLYIAGIGLARGYINRPELTAQTFIPNPFSATPGARMYLSGDLARYLPDGAIEYLGRSDHQVKIRGLRIELGEIEAVLASLEAVRDAVVLARADERNVARLVAYLVAHDGQALPEPTSLRTTLLKTLPDYMVPEYFVALDGLPLTSNGKVDRNALPAPDMLQSEAVYVAPRTPTEKIIADIWADVLSVEHVSVFDDFFKLGGHSLLAIALIERMRRAALPVDIKTFFVNPNVAALAEATTRSGSEVIVPANGIPLGCTHITPAMVTLTALSSADLARIVDNVPGGAANIQDIYPLSPAQEGILFHHLMAEERDAYVMEMQLAFDTRGHLDRFVAALETIIARHDVLRTAVLWQELAEPVQVVWRQAPAIIEEVRLAPDSDAAAQLSARYNPLNYRLDVRQAPLIRCFVAHDVANDRWLMQVLSHHLIDDNTSLKLMAEELRTIVDGRGATLPAPLPFRNFVHQARTGVSQAEHEAFFRSMLAHVEEPTTPFGLLDVQGDGADIAEAHLQVEANLARRLRQQARKLGVSTASLMHMAWAQVLSRLSGQRDVVFGTVLFGRIQGGEGADRAFGMFINTLPICISTGPKRALDGVRDTHALLTQLLRHEHASLALAQRASGIAAPTPLFTALLNYRHNVSVDAMNAHDVAGMQLIGMKERTNYPCMLSVDDTDDGFGLIAQIAGAERAQRVCQYMHSVLEHLAEALETYPDARIDSLEVMPAAERQQVLHEWNQVAVASPSIDTHPLTIPQWFEAQVARTPDAVAVMHAGVALSYVDLNRRANQLAHHLRKLGVGPDVLVGVCMTRTPDLIVSLLGILKAGGAYVPLDPAYPAERIATMLMDAQPRVLLTQRHLQAVLPTVAGTSVIYMDTAAETLIAHSHDNPVETCRGGNLAYVIYTSGSTGKPKGVAIEHKNAAVFIQWALATFDRDSLDKVLASTSVCFDLSVFEIFVPLSRGGSTWLVENILEFAQKSDDLPVTLVNTVPSAMAEVHRNKPLPRSVKVINLAGEALPNALAQSLYEQPSLQQVFNLYGPSEDTTYSTFTQVEKGATAAVTIGRPIARTQTYILDAQWNPVPIGVAGELFIGGDGLARGYLQRPELTAEKFIPNPFVATPGARMYRTGDLVRYRTDGQIEYLGRIDHQVKIRGFRIELGEIETALQALASEVVVLAREDHAGDKRLVAYLVARDGDVVPDEAQLRASLSQTLPSYMLPSYFIALERMPLTPNGKIDRKALPAPEMIRSDAGYVAPRSIDEQRMATIWAEILKLDKVGLHDDFFELGGHSLLATQLMSRIAAVFQVDVSLRAIFDAPYAGADGRAHRAGQRGVG